MKSLRKVPFLLLEVLVALTLVILCAVPLILKPIQVYRAERFFLEEVEGERLADLTFSEIKEKLLNNEIAWEKIPDMNQTSSPFKLPPGTLFVPGRAPKRVERTYTLRCKGEKKGLNGETYKMIHVKVEFSPELSRRKKKENAYRYRVAVRLLPQKFGKKNDETI